MGSSFFPPANGGNPNWEQLVTLYVSPEGSDSNSGRGWNSPLLTMYGAAEALVSAGGGTVNFADGVSIGGPVSGQGLCFRGDGFDVPGFLPVVPMRWIGHGKHNGSG